MLGRCNWRVARRTGKTTRHRDELATDGLGDEGSADIKSERCDPTNEVVGDRCQHRPGRVGIEVARGTVLEARAFLEVTDGEFDDGVTTVVGVEEGGVTDTVGDEGVVAVVGKERRVGARSVSCDERRDGVLESRSQPTQASPFMV